MTTVQQQIDFITQLRERKFKSLLVVKAIAQALNMPDDKVHEFLRDVNDSLHGVKLWEVGKKVEFCKRCNKPLTRENRVACAVDSEGEMKVHPGEHVCFDCAVVLCVKRAGDKPKPYEFLKPEHPDVITPDVEY